MADTRAAAILAAIRERWSKVAYVGLKPEVVPEPGRQPEWLPDVPRLVAAVEAAMRGHGSEGVYLAAADCGHPEPCDPAAYDRWDAEHPYGEGDIGRICKLTEIGRYCPACTLLTYDEDFPVGDDYVATANCIVIPAISAALAGEDGPG